MHGLELSNGFMVMIPKAAAIKEEINWTSSKFKTFLCQEQY